MANNKDVVLSVKNLTVHFSTDHGYVQAVRGVSFDLYKGETLCIVGESGSGKSVTSKTIMGILAANGRIIDGSIMYEGEDLTRVSEDEFHRIRGHKIGMIFQDPLSSLNPIVRIGKQITEAMLVNSSRIKKLYEDKISEELVAYKNVKTELHNELTKKKERIKFLKVEREKEIRKAKDYPVIVKSGKTYTEKISYKSDLSALKEAYLGKIQNAKTEEEKIALKQQYEQEKAAKTASFAEFIKNVKEEKRANVIESKQKIKDIKASFKKQIEEVKNGGTSSKELKAKYGPIIKEKKIAYNKKCKFAKAEIREYKAKIKAEYVEGKKKVLLMNVSDEEKKELLRVCKETYIYKTKITRKEAKAKALEIMKEVGISNPEKRYRQYPFEFSGGMRQRIVIAIALTADPDILICDEPTTALDVTIQAQILELINKLKRERNLSCIFITHDLGVVANMADRVAVMYAGKIVEYGTEEDIFYNPKHPYTWALLSSIPDINSKEKLEAIPGTPPNMIYPPVGDAFALRSKYALAIDFKKEPPFFKVSDTHYAATWLLDPRAPKVEMPAIVKTRIENSLKNAKKEVNE
ncbi:MAG: ABC transporter ATP-binding protein [Bacilli bacterium]|nr:ABC transporter ATP-binding protein [Bacilli bacterium]